MIKKTLILILLFTLSLFASNKAALGLNINPSDLEIEGRTTLAFTNDDPVFRNFYVDANFINSDETLFGLGLFVENSPTNYQNIYFAIGLRAIFSEYGNRSFAAIPITIGAKARMYLGDLPKSHLGLKFAYAPNPLSFQDSNSYIEYRVEVDMSIIDNVDLYVGYRSINTNYKNLDKNFNNSLYIGFKFVLN